MIQRVIVLSITVSMLAAVPVWAQEAGSAEDRMMQAAMAAATPGEHHQHLARMAGEFSYTAKAWMKPGAPTMEWAGNRSAKMILGGRYLEEHADGSFQGMPYQGRGLWAYDNLAGHYIYAWIDNMGTTLTQCTGSCSEAGWVMEGTHRVPGVDGESPFKTVMKTVDDDTFVFEWHEALPGQEDMFKMMEITYKRK